MAEIWTLEPGARWPPGLECLDRVVEDGAAAAAERAPALLYGLGDRALVGALDPRRAVTIVGARRSTPEGRIVAHEMAASLASAGMVVVSGMAFGIDSAAHLGALSVGGPTVAVLAGGADVPYPRSARRLYERIIAGGGAVVSEIEPGRPPEKWAFPARNRIMAALSKVTVLVEAANPSGSRITADKAQQLGRDVGAVPGPVGARLSEGPHALIREGAHLIRGAQDVLDLALGVGARDARRIGPELEPELGVVLAQIGPAGASGEEVASESELESAQVAVALSRLELLGYLRSSGGRLVRTGLEPPEL